MNHHLWLGVVLLLTLFRGATCLRNINLEIVPWAVERGREAILRCRYNLGDVPLYSVKWYRGRHEFYRYTPKDSPTTKTFPIPGINIDLASSNGTQVMLHDVDFRLSGNFSCEVTADAPSFSTAMVTKYLTVVARPQSKPVIASDRQRYESGDILRANCSSAPSKPATQLTFMLNNAAVDEAIARQYPVQSSDGQEQRQQQMPQKQQGPSNQGILERSELVLALPLTPSHYLNGQLNLRCFAEIPGIYSSQSDVLQLGPGLREPVPERVTSENSSHGVIASSITLLCFSVLHLLLR